MLATHPRLQSRSRKNSSYTSVSPLHLHSHVIRRPLSLKSRSSWRLLRVGCLTSRPRHEAPSKRRQTRRNIPKNLGFPLLWQVRKNGMLRGGNLSRTAVRTSNLTAVTTAFWPTSPLLRMLSFGLHPTALISV